MYVFVYGAWGLYIIDEDVKRTELKQSIYYHSTAVVLGIIKQQYIRYKNRTEMIKTKRDIWIPSKYEQIYEESRSKRSEVVFWKKCFFSFNR